MNVGQLAFSIVNIVFGGCCGGFILGIIALVLTISATGARDDNEEKSKLNTAKTLNIIGIVITVVATVLTVIIYINNPELIDIYYPVSNQ